MKNEHKIDQLFKAGLENQDIPFNEAHWEDMAKKLDAEKKKRLVPLWYTSAGVAAGLLILLFAVLFEPQPVTKNQTSKNVRLKKGTPAQRQDQGQVQSQATSNAGPGLNSNTENNVSSDAKNNKKRHSAPGAPLKGELKEQPAYTASTIGITPKFLSALTSVRSQSDSARFIPMKTHDVHFAARKPEFTAVPRRRALSFSILAAPDISTTSANLSSKVSTNIGLLITYPITSKISLSTGVIYAKKLYNSGGIAAIGNGYMDNSWELNADCRVLDIPLNMNYQVFKKQRLSVSINAGLSSYLMLNERYQLKMGPYDNTSAIEVRNKNQHPFGVANLSIGVQRKINSSLSIGLEPFVKLPLTGIGDYDARLKSTGVALSLNFGLSGRK